MTFHNVELLFLGWLLYWITTAGVVFKQNKQTFNPLGFLEDNVFEITGSVTTCLVIIVLGPGISPDMIDLKAGISVLGAGYGSASLLNKLLSFRKS
jgi:hypothetical protein